jgi:uncharacterized protein (DUF488 family)
MREYKDLRNLLDNHSKLLSMISDKNLPIKQTLLNDVAEMSKILELSKHRREVHHEKPNPTTTR